MVLNLIDVSNHQGAINWDAVAQSGVKGAFIKATEGNFFRDGWFAYNWSECKRVGLFRGAYHYARPSSGTTAEQEAYFFLDNINANGGIEAGDALVLDNEDDRFHGNVVPWAVFWMQIVNNVTGFNPIHYTGPWYINSRMPDKTDLMPYALWLADYPNTPDSSRWPKSFREVDFWQYTSSGRVPGVAGNCDANWFRGTEADLRKYGKPASEPQPSPIDLEKLRSGLSALSNSSYELSQDALKMRNEADSLIAYLDSIQKP
jgi:lysozyme